MRPERCAGCTGELAATDLACPSCHTLVHAAELKLLAARAETEQASGRVAEAIETWRRTLALLPRETKQHASITTRVTELEVASRVAAKSSTLSKVATGAAAALFGLWKLKAVVPSLVTMALSFGAYLSVYSWRFALGLVLSLWIHEMGHVFELRRRGLAFSWPMFIPGLGAYVRLKQEVPDPQTDARIGLAGPIAGALAAVACMAVYRLDGDELWFGLAQAGAVLNLFNLTPLFVLDGGRAFNAMSRVERAGVTIALGAALHLSNNSLLWLPLIGALMRLFGKPPERGDAWTFVTFLALIGLLSTLAAQPG